MSNARKVKKPSSTLVSKGSYAIYEDASGNGVIAYRQDGEDKDSHQVVPAKFWSLATRMLRGEVTDMNPVSLMKMLMSK